MTSRKPVDRMGLRFICLAMAALCFGGSVDAQTDTSATTQIRRLVQEIDRSKGYAVRTLENEEFLEQMTDGGGELTGLTRNGQLVTMTERVGLSSCVTIAEYYFENTELVFVSVQGSEFAYVDSTASFDPGVQDLTMQAMFYYHNDHVLEVDLKGSTRCGGAPTKEWATLYQVEANRLRELLMR
ncbi:MAG: hypothetical protein IPO17_01130 [Flavobacteriales bacterium]|nr:hypothetical protein [Flavobacteriales bacterium]